MPLRTQSEKRNKKIEKKKQEE
uniref:Receptor-like protein kinase At3g21340 n=1 Tax=Rhizophora mucronata TaxID=61149 RepID=A0A2P2MES8_RHIMU